MPSESETPTRWYHLVSYFFGGAFLANTVPHFVAGISGSPFQSPFASPPGEGLSSATVNVLWGLFNLVVGYLLVVRVGRFDLRRTLHTEFLGLRHSRAAVRLAPIDGDNHVPCCVRWQPAMLQSLRFHATLTGGEVPG